VQDGTRSLHTDKFWTHFVDLSDLGILKSPNCIFLLDIW